MSTKVGSFFAGHPIVLFLTGVAVGFSICYFMPDNLFGASAPAAPAAK